MKFIYDQEELDVQEEGELDITPVKFGKHDSSVKGYKNATTEEVHKAISNMVIQKCKHCGHTRADHECEYVYCNGMCHHNAYTDDECLCMEYKE